MMSHGSNRIPAEMPAGDALAFLARIVDTAYDPPEEVDKVARILRALSDLLRQKSQMHATAADLLAGYIHLATQQVTPSFSAKRIRSYGTLGALLGASGVCPAVNRDGAIAIWQAWMNSIRGLGRYDMDVVLVELEEELGMLQCPK